MYPVTYRQARNLLLCLELIDFTLCNEHSTNTEREGGVIELWAWLYIHQPES